MRKMVFTLFAVLFINSACLAESEAQKFLNRIYEKYGEGLIPKDVLEKECSGFCRVELKRGLNLEYLDCFEDCLENEPIGREAVKTARELVSVLSDNCYKADLKRKTSVSLILMGRFAVKPLVEKITSNADECVVLACMDVLRDIGENAVGSQGCLIDQMLNNYNDSIKDRAAETLSDVGPSQGFENYLIKGLDDKREIVRLSSAINLGRLGKDALPASSKLLRLALEDKFVSVQKAAISAIGNIGSDAKANVPALLVLMGEDPDKKTERWALPLYAAKALIQISPELNNESVYKIIENIDFSKSINKDFASTLLIKLGKSVRTDLDMIRSLKRTDGKISSRLSIIISEIDRRENE